MESSLSTGARMKFRVRGKNPFLKSKKNHLKPYKQGTASGKTRVKKTGIVKNKRNHLKLYKRGTASGKTRVKKSGMMPSIDSKNTKIEIVDEDLAHQKLHDEPHFYSQEYLDKLRDKAFSEASAIFKEYRLSQEKSKKHSCKPFECLGFNPDFHCPSCPCNQEPLPDDDDTSFE